MWLRAPRQAGGQGYAHKLLLAQMKDPEQVMALCLSFPICNREVSTQNYWTHCNQPSQLQAPYFARPCSTQSLGMQDFEGEAPLHPLTTARTATVLHSGQLNLGRKYQLTHSRATHPEATTPLHPFLNSAAGLQTPKVTKSY